MLGGIAFAIGLSLIVALVRVVRPHTAEVELVEGTDTFRDIERHDDAHAIPGLMVYRIDDELFFANAAFFVRDVKERLIASDPPATALMLDFEGVSDIDTTAVQQLNELLEDLDDADVRVTPARVRTPEHDMLERAKTLDRGAVYLEVDDAVAGLSRQRRLTPTPSRGARSHPSASGGIAGLGADLVTGSPSALGSPRGSGTLTERRRARLRVLRLDLTCSAGGSPMP